jgi:hypothetical protein
MSKNITEIPYTEIVERASELARERAEVRSKVRGIVNDFYTRELPNKEDWSFFFTSSALTLKEEYKTGTISSDTGSTTVTFSSDVSLNASYTGRKLRISGNDYIYDFTYSNATGGTINPPLSGTQNVSASSYSLFQPFYSLAQNFDRFPKNGGLIDYRGGKRYVISEKAYQDFNLDYEPSPSDTQKMCRLNGVDTAGCTLVEVNPPPRSAKSLQCDFIWKPKPLKETTAGTVSVSATGTTVTGDSNTLFTEATTGDYLRIDAFGIGNDSSWYRIIAINGNSSLTIQSAFGSSAATGALYTICSAPEIPSKLHPALLYSTILALDIDQDDKMSEYYKMKLAEVLSDGKRLYKTRIYSQEIHHLGEDWNYRR